MKTTGSRNRMPHRFRLNLHIVAAVVRRLTAYFAFAAALAVALHYGDRKLETASPDPFHPSVARAQTIR